MRSKEEIWEQTPLGWQKTVRYTYAGGKVVSYIFDTVPSKNHWPTILLVKMVDFDGVKSIKKVKK
jgi:hypothetical protein